MDYESNFKRNLFSVFSEAEKIGIMYMYMGFFYKEP